MAIAPYIYQNICPIAEPLIRNAIDSELFPQNQEQAFQSQNAKTFLKSKNSKYLNEFLISLPSLVENNPTICKALYKEEGYFSRLFSNESWDDWTENRTTLGKVVDLYISYMQVPSKAALRRKKSLVSKANLEAKSILESLKEDQEGNIEVLTTIIPNQKFKIKKYFSFTLPQEFFPLLDSFSFSANRIKSETLRPLPRRISFNPLTLEFAGRIKNPHKYKIWVSLTEENTKNVTERFEFKIIIFDPKVKEVKILLIIIGSIAALFFSVAVIKKLDKWMHLKREITPRDEDHQIENSNLELSSV